MRRLRNDLDWLVSAGLLLSVAITAGTGVIADLWDLNDFWYHTVAGYVMGGLAVAHVAFNWERLVNYGRFRLRGLTRDDRRPGAAPRLAAKPREAGHRPSPAPSFRSVALSRRGLFGLAVGSIGGWILGRGLRPPPQITAGSDVGVVYHEWSKPGLIDALGSVADRGQFPAQ